jgi:hypothetical protein
MSHPQFSGGPTGMLIELDENTSNLWGGGNAGYPSLGETRLSANHSE